MTDVHSKRWWLRFTLHQFNSNMSTPVSVLWWTVLNVLSEQMPMIVKEETYSSRQQLNNCWYSNTSLLQWQRWLQLWHHPCFPPLNFSPMLRQSFLSFFISAVHLHLVLGHKGKYYGQNCSKESRSGPLPTVTLLPHAVAELPNCLRVLVSDKSDSSNRHVICTRCFCLPLVIVKGNPTIIKTIIFIFLFIKSLKEGLTCLLVCIHQPHKCHSRAQSLSFHRQTWIFSHFSTFLKTGFNTWCFLIYVVLKSFTVFGINISTEKRRWAHTAQDKIYY